MLAVIELLMTQSCAAGIAACCRMLMVDFEAVLACDVSPEQGRSSETIV